MWLQRATVRNVNRAMRDIQAFDMEIELDFPKEIHYTNTQSPRTH